MAGLCRMAVVLVFLLSAGHSSAAVDQNWLTRVIEGIKNEYDLGDTFSLAVNVPQNQDKTNLEQVFQNDPTDTVKQTVSKGEVYRGTRVVAAADSKALKQVLDNIQPLITSSEENFLIIYSKEFPCGSTCATTANEDNITAEVNNVIKNWSGYAFVFSKVVNVPTKDASQLAESFKQLGIAKLGLDNIFRCYKPGDDPFQCTSCSSGGDVTPSCVANNVPSNQKQGVGEKLGTVSSTDTGKEEAPGEEKAASEEEAPGEETATSEEEAPGEETAASEEEAPGEETAPGEEMGAGIHPEISIGIGGGLGGSRGSGERGRVDRCKGHGSLTGGCKRRGGSRLGKVGKFRKGRKPKRGGSRRGKVGKVRRQCKRRGGGGMHRGGGRCERSGRVRKAHKPKRGGGGRGLVKPQGGRRSKGKRLGWGGRQSMGIGGGGGWGVIEAGVAGDCNDSEKIALCGPENLSSSPTKLIKDKTIA